MRLFIAEKPSVGRELAAYLGGGKGARGAGYIRCGDDVVTWAYGHILTQYMPEDYDARYRRWRMDDLPIIPQEWKLQVSPAAKAQYKVICQLLQEATEIVHAGDPDREGQLLIDEILEYTQTQKPVRRILINALDEKSIRDALAHIQDNARFAPLRDSALARSRADWLIGMNLSRAYTLQARRQGHARVVFPIGRVKTPTLALVVRREETITNFVPQEYFLVKVDFTTAAGVLSTKWKPAEDQVGLDSEGRLIQQHIGTALLERLAAAPEGKITGLTKQKKQEPPPLPLSLSALQVLAGKMYGYDPQAVLDAAQALYERKYTTYPRSDCDYLPKSQLADVPAIIRHLTQTETLGEMAQGADQTRISRAWNDSKITAHHAIIPTTVSCPTASLTTVQRHVYELIARAYLVQFYPPYQYEQTKVTITAVEELFTASGRVEIEAGWRAWYRRDGKKDKADADTDEKEEQGQLPPVKKGEAVVYRSGQLDSKTTKPPTRFTPATLLEAMKGIHRFVHDERLKKQLRAVAGIGTEATRATIIEELTKRGFIREKGAKRYLYPTEKAHLLMAQLPEHLTYPDETAIWEERLAEMSEGRDSLDSFLGDQVAYVTKLVGDTKRGASCGGRRDTTPEPMTTQTRTVAVPARTVICTCGKPMRLRKGPYGEFYGCSGYPKCHKTKSMDEVLREQQEESSQGTTRTGGDER